MIKTSQTLDRDNLNKAFLSKTALGMQIMLGSLHIHGSVNIQGDAYFGEEGNYYINSIGSARLSNLITTGGINIENGNSINFEEIGSDSPSGTIPSEGTKIRLWGNHHALGIESNYIWYDAQTGHKFYTNDNTQTSTLRAVINTNGLDVSGYLESDSVRFKSPGPDKGIHWLGGNEWKIYESPDNLSDNSGNLQFISNSTRVMTLNINGEVEVSKIRVTSTSDASLSSTGHAFQVGSTNSANLIIDQNEVMARNNGSPAELYLNADGGDVSINGNGTGVGNLKVRGVIKTNEVSIGSGSNMDKYSIIYNSLEDSLDFIFN